MDSPSVSTGSPYSYPEAELELPNMSSSDETRIPSNEDPELEGLTLFEKKARLVDRELASQGMGRYQWMVFFLCGFGYFLDLLWAQAFGFILASIQQEFGFGDTQAGDLSTCFSAGLTAGAAIFGIIVDIIGRYWAFNVTVLIASIFGICLGAPNSYEAVLILTAFVGLGVGGNIPIDTTICLEMLPHNRRWLLPTLSVFQPLGVIVCSAVAYGFIPFHSCAPDLEACSKVAAGQPCCTKADNYGWRYLMFTLGAITIVVFIFRSVLFRFKETPKYLLYRGRDDEAVKVLEYIARYNNVPCNINTETFVAITGDTLSTGSSNSSQSGKAMLGSGMKQRGLGMIEQAKSEFLRLRILFETPSMAWLVVCIWIIYMFDYWGFTIAGTYLPLVLRRKGSALGLSLQQTYLSYIYIYIFGIPGVLAGTMIYKWRRLSLFVSSTLFGAMLFTFTAVKGQGSYIGISGLVYFFQSMFNGILYGLTPELFPAPIRGTACGVSSFWGRLFSIIAPLAAAQVLNVSLNGVFYLAGGGVFVCSLMVLLLPGKHLDSQSY